MLKDSSSGYGWLSIALHWVCALLIFFLFGLGVYMRSLDYYSPWYHKGPALHIALGLLVFALMLLRAIWRSRNTQPLAIPTIGKTTRVAATWVKFLLYVGVFLICLSGYLITTAEGDAASFFGLFSIPATLKLSADNVDLAGEIHEYLAWTIIFIALAHGGAAIFHHFFKRDKTLVRMLKPASKSE
jgi:cytochrome b561